MMKVLAATTRNVALFGPAYVDGVAVPHGKPLLATCQDDALENGVYLANDHGAWARLPGKDVVRVTGGVCYSETTWVRTASNPVLWLQLSARSE